MKMIDIGQIEKGEIMVLAEDSVEYESSLLGQHGISLFLKAESAKTVRRVLMDVGQNFDALHFNMNALGIEPGSIDSVVLTHCHYDHTRGLVKLLESANKGDIAIVAHPDIYRIHFITDPHLRHIGVGMDDGKRKVEDAGGTFYLTRDPLQIMTGISTTGEVQRRTDFEDPGLSLFTVESGSVVPDPMKDDISVILNVRDKGLVILSGCSHAGIVNIVHQAVEITGISQIEGIIGGFHLVEASEEKIEKTVDALTRFNIHWIAAGHCTGFRAQASLYTRFGRAFIPLRTGMKFIL
jgi:7,8-dihydropterin-6-yl-methyl-4-(beta-D-ribofuranosyl)aminobenzene 5'-phosphate synthase